MNSDTTVRESAFDDRNIAAAIKVVSRRLENEHHRYHRGSQIRSVGMVTPISPDEDKLTFVLEVNQGDRTRRCRMRFEKAETRRRSVEQFRGKRDLSLLVIFIRPRDSFCQIITRIYKRVGLIIADIRREVDYFRRTGRADQPPPVTSRKWRRRRRHWCHRHSYMAPAFA